MQRSLLLFSVICIFVAFITAIADCMVNDKSAIIRFLGYCIAVIMAVGVLWLVLYCYFDINLLNIAL